MSLPREVVSEIAGRESRLQQAARRKAVVQSVPAPNKIRSAKELMALVFPEPKWAIPGLLPEGVNILAGRPKLGKSWLALNIAVAVASGGRAVGAIEVEGGDVFYLALEDGERRLQDRLRTTLAGGAVPENLSFVTVWEKFDEGGLPKLREWLVGHPNARLIIIDTLKRVRPHERMNSRLYDGDYDAIGPLGDLAREFGVCVVVVHHTRKADSEDPLDLVSGSLGLTGAADGVLVLKRARGQADAVLHATGRDFEDKEIALRWDAALTTWRMLGDASEFKRSNERQELIDLFKAECKPLAPKAVSDILDRDRSAIRKLLWTMARDGELHADGNGRYSLPNTGRQLPDDFSIPAGSDVDKVLEAV
ncbi:MAG: AAA family ATPase, partial [bacterium]